MRSSTDGYQVSMILNISIGNWFRKEFFAEIL